jgi:hypothetical protein
MNVGELRVAWAGNHPYVEAQAIGARREYRISGNRWVRRKAREVTRRWAAAAGDDFAERLPGRNDGWDTWMVF